MKQTKNLNFVIAFCEDVVLFTDEHFKVLNSFNKSGAGFKAIAADNYGNVFLADSKNGFVYMLSQNGVFQQNVFSENEGISNTTDMIVDECGHLWLVVSSKSIQNLDMSDKKIICPLCKTTIALPDEGVGGLKSYPFKLKCFTEEKPVMDA
ncbi:Hypothetical predicted protein [Mytilus galloprovincialis]|uniref:Uncharacterized protein n=1 Tax=Mytilus galloprovincialis TaxID=29158 RepID=A0A8B6DD29_MYTGA|nr:Hypothetical predicted protein [Mytilus galloprovincialis]